MVFGKDTGTELSEQSVEAYGYIVVEDVTSLAQKKHQRLSIQDLIGLFNSVRQPAGSGDDCGPTE
jgi:hypothetical protein